MDIQETPRSRQDYKDHRFLISSIRELNEHASRHLHQELTPVVKSVKGIYLLSREDIEELKNDTLLITVKERANMIVKNENHDFYDNAVKFLYEF